MIGYKLFSKRKDGSYGPLFINRRQRMEVGVKYEMEDHPTMGFARRPGWHICKDTDGAPHIKQDAKGTNRVWCKVEFDLLEEVRRPESQGGLWYLGKSMKIIEEIG